MHLHAAFIPPAAVRQELADLVASLEPADPQQAPASRRGRFGRRTAEGPVASGPQLTVEDVGRMALPVTDFGYLASGDARRVADALDTALAELAAPTVHVHGGAALVDEDDRSVWAELAGEDDSLPELRSVAQRVVAAIEPLGFFRDRRQFKPRFAIASITDSTTVEHLEAVLAGLTSYTSEAWTVGELTVLQRGSGVWRTIPIG